MQPLKPRKENAYALLNADHFSFQCIVIVIYVTFKSPSTTF